MADLKLSELDPAATLAGAELVYAVQSGASVATTAQEIADLALGGATLDTDTALAADSDTRVPSQRAVKTYVAGLIAADGMAFKGVLDCSANPNYPAANAGDLYKVSVAGKIGGASGPNVEAGDTLYCTADSTASGNHATVGSSWAILQVNVDGAVTGPASATSGNLAVFSGTSGKVIADGGPVPAGTVTSVALSVPTGLSVSGSPIAGSGTLAVTWANQSAAQVLAGPASGGAAAPTFRALAASDLPVAPVITTISWASTISVDLTGAPRGAIFRCTLAGNTTVNITGGTDGQMAVIELKQDGTGSRLVTLGSGFGFGTDLTSYTASTAADKTDVLGVIYNSAAAKYRLLLAVKGY